MTTKPIRSLVDKECEGTGLLTLCPLVSLNITNDTRDATMPPGIIQYNAICAVYTAQSRVYS